MHAFSLRLVLITIARKKINSVILVYVLRFIILGAIIYALRHIGIVTANNLSLYTTILLFTCVEYAYI